MSKRTDTIKSLFAAQAATPLSADNALTAPPRVTAGSVRSVRDTFSEVEKENEALRKQMETGARVVEIDPALIDPSPLSDRLREDADLSFESLKQSIAHRGQEVPVLLRPHPKASGRYQSAYGHRRIRAARELGVLVKATIRELSDENLVVAQGTRKFSARRPELHRARRFRNAYRGCWTYPVCHPGCAFHRSGGGLETSRCGTSSSLRSSSRRSAKRRKSAADAGRRLPICSRTTPP